MNVNLVIAFVGGALVGSIVTAMWPAQVLNFVTVEQCVLHDMRGRQLALLPMVKTECQRLVKP
jgi:hypothetical protein